MNATRGSKLGVENIKAEVGELRSHNEPISDMIIIGPQWTHHWKRISDKRTKNQAKMDKIEHGMEKREKSKSRQKP
ncbi:hypothetical protein Tco_0011963 [Tanacetum coccineum]